MSIFLETLSQCRQKFNKQHYRKESIPEETKDDEFETEASKEAIEKSLMKTNECLEKGTKQINLNGFLECIENLKLNLPYGTFT